MRGAGFGIVVVLVGQFCVLPRLALAAPAARQEAEDGSLDPVSPSTMYSACQEIFLQKSTAGGAFGSWNSAQAGINPVDRVDFIPPLVIDAAHSSTLYFGDTAGHIFRTANRGAGWDDITGNLPNVPVNGVVVNAAKPAQIFVGTDIGVFYSSTSGNTWTSLVDGLPRAAVTGLVLDSVTKTLRATTYGRGAWDIKIATLR